MAASRSVTAAVPTAPQPAPTARGMHPDALDLPDLTAQRADLGLEHDLVAVEAGERASGVHQLGDPRPVADPAVPGAAGSTPTSSVNIATAAAGSGRARPSAGGRTGQRATAGARRAPSAAAPRGPRAAGQCRTALPQRQHQLSTPDDRRAARRPCRGPGRRSAQGVPVAVQRTRFAPRSKAVEAGPETHISRRGATVQAASSTRARPCTSRRSASGARERRRGRGRRAPGKPQHP